MNADSRSIRWLLLATILVLSALTAQAQSGRRQTRETPAAPIPTPTPEPTPKPKSEQKKSDLVLFVGIDRSSLPMSYPYSYLDAVLRGCGGRLRDGSAADVDIVGDWSRSDAIKKAKAAKPDQYVIYLQLSMDSISRSGNQNDDDLAIEYIVYASVTAKVVTSGRTYQNPKGKGPLVIGPKGGSVLYREQLLERAGEDAADRILSALHLVIPSTVPHFSAPNVR